MGRFFYGGGTISSVAEIPNRAHDLLTQLADDDHLQYLRELASTGDLVAWSNTAAEQDLWSVTVPANVVPDNGALLLELVGSVLNNTAGAQTFTFRLRHPTGTVAMATGAISVAQGATERALRVAAALYFSAVGAGGSYRSYLRGAIGPLASAGGTAGIVATDQIGTNLATAVDTTADQLLRITVQMGVANANLATQRWGARLSVWRG